MLQPAASINYTPDDDFLGYASRSGSLIGCWFSSFSRKRSKKRCSASQKGCWPKSRRSRPRGAGGLSPEDYLNLNLNNWSDGILLFPEKEAKSVVLLRRRVVGTDLGEADQGSRQLGLSGSDW
jgi:hypothetical protein